MTNPAAPVKLGAPGQPTGGDTGPDDGSLSGNEVEHSNHSTVMWESGGRLYLMTVDNIEIHDVDIHDISDPANPVDVAEYDLLEIFPQIEDSGNIGSFAGTFHHDTKMKIINGQVIVNTSYWDGGYVTYDLTDPLAPKFIGDTSFDMPDPLFPGMPAPGLPEGNAHYADFSFDNKFILAADEDFTTHRSGSFDVEGVPYDAAGVGGGNAAAILPDRVMNGPTVYGGYACDASLAAKPVPLRSNYNFALESGEEAILVVQRGPTQDTNNPEAACFPGEKAKNAWDAGWRNVLFINRHLGSADADEPFCGSGDFRTGKIPVAICTTHEAAHDIFNKQPPQYALPYDDETDLVPVGTQGGKVRATSQFDGWGYAHLFRNEAGKQTLIDSYAVEESLDERYSAGFGDLSIHEHAPDPGANVSYIAYYGAGRARDHVQATTAGSIEETGAFIDQGGNNFWGVEHFNGPDGRAADRVLRPRLRPVHPQVHGAARREPSNRVAARRAGSDAAGRRSRRDQAARLAALELRGRACAVCGRTGSSSASPWTRPRRSRSPCAGASPLKRGGRGAVRTLKSNRAIDVAAGRTVTVTLKPSAALRRKLRSEKRLPGLLSVKATDAAGNMTTRTKTLTFR